MKLKKYAIGALAGAAVLGMSCAASAADIEINVYGASAQYLYWNDAADGFLTDTAVGYGCDPATVRQYEDAAGKNGVTIASGCTGDTSMIIRYSAKASYDGIWAMNGDPQSTEGCIPPGGTNISYYHRMMADVPTTGGVVTQYKCVDVTLGASDVEGKSFSQSSAGLEDGPNVGGWITRAFYGIDTSGLDNYEPLKVPFGFFASNDITVTKCLAPHPLAPDANAHKAISTWGNYCDSDQDGHSTDCIGYYKCINDFCSGGVQEGQPCEVAKDCPDVALVDTDCAEMPLDNISRIMAVLLYSGLITHWNDFGAYFPSQPVTLCFRHAGSGTHATLDWAVMRGNNAWGTGMLTAQQAGPPIAWFNDGSSDMMRCINGATTVSTTYAIGYADADQLAGTKNYPNVHALKYQGVEPRRWTIRNGTYSFWSSQQMYEDPLEPNYAVTNPVIAKLVAFASAPANMPATKADYWATAEEMKVTKTSDNTYPYSIPPVTHLLP